MTNLVEFLRARLDEDERDARSVDDDPDGRDDLYFWADANGLGLCINQSRMLAEVEAKRRIIDLHCPLWGKEHIANYPQPESCEACEEFYPCQTLRLLALPYADHPDYQKKWNV